MPHFDRDGAAIFFTDEGEAAAPPDRTAMLLHGWSCDSHDWSWQIPALLEAGYRVIAVDHRGHGRSSAPEGEYRPEVLADDAAALLDHLGLSSVTVVGHSMGTVVASALAVQRPELVGRLVLVDPVYQADAEAIRPMVTALEGPDACRVAVAAFGRGFYTEDTPAWLITWHARRVQGTPPHVVRGCIQGLFGSPDSIGLRDVAKDYLQGRRAPTLAVYANDAATSLDRELLTSPGSRVEVIADGGHFLHQHRADRFNALMLEWLAEDTAALTR